MHTLTCRHDVQLLALDFFAPAVEESILGEFAVQRLCKKLNSEIDSGIDKDMTTPRHLLTNQMKTLSRCAAVCGFASAHRRAVAVQSKLLSAPCIGSRSQYHWGFHGRSDSTRRGLRRCC